ncbi:hypothetical protein BDP27DRAFT_1421950 [Rhodocollybia butyracea]|uniref:DUF6533 domain-containing protein n=1 Tax=Rhodocollybia butyracea TaxID=206335 RepID=A0A9P5U6W7_9AGAR|nr:hypothetical protein BDP27DRAFT_1421950 [Rhodocollybia butyracea]
MHIRLGAAGELTSFQEPLSTKHFMDQVLGLVATGCDVVITMRGEMQFIWKKPLRITFVRCLFVLMRYIPIALHISNIILTSIWLDGTEQISEHRCRIMMIFRLLAFSTMLMLLELVLILRVYALYDRSWAVGVSLLLLLMSRITSSAYSVHDHLLRSPEKIKFIGHCVPSVNFDDGRNVVWVLSFVTSVIIILALKRTVWDFRQYSHSLFSVLNKDGLKVFSVIFVAVVATTLTSIKKGVNLYFFIFPLFISIISAAGCHTILNLQRLESELADADGNSSEHKRDIELTTISNVDIATWDAPWDARTFRIIEDETI